MKSWNRFLHQYQKDVKLWLLLVLYFFVFRLVFIFYFRTEMDAASGWRDIVSVALQGFRYDAKVATTAVLLPFLFSAASGLAGLERISNRFKSFYSSLVLVLATVTCVVTIGYFKEYDDQFNHFLFNLYYDDAGAVFSTIWSSYHPLAYLSAVVIISALVITAKERFLKDGALKNALAEFTRTLPLRIVAVVVILSLFALGARGTFRSARLKRMEAAVTRDEFLNKMVVNPMYSLEGAYRDFQRGRTVAGVETFLPDKDVRRAAQAVFSPPQTLNDLDEYMKKYARGHRNRPPRHIFFILMESYDAWPLLPRYASLGLTDNLKKIAHSGLFIENFLPSGMLTMPSFTSIITGIPYSSVDMNYVKTAHTAFPSALAGTFRRLGYRTRLFYGGFLTWHRIGEFSKAQGFEEIYGAPHVAGTTAHNEWGVEDEYLFDFVTRMADDARPSFNLILTMSNHPPYDVDVWKKGFPLKEAPRDLARSFDNSVTLSMLGHLWYQDRCIGRFVGTMEKKLPRVLFAFTGDHYGRKFINAKPDAYERSAVPFVLYGKDVLKGLALPKGVAGSHIDIGPTLIELSAPKGFTYYSVGKDLLAPGREFAGIGWRKVIGQDYLFDLDTSKIYPLPGGALPGKLPDIDRLKSLANDYYGIGWWRVSRGPKL